jgi:hypothetical protein
MSTEKIEETERMDWEGSVYVPTDKEYATAMEQLVNETTAEELGRTISGVLEFLTMKAFHEGPYYIMTDDEQALTVFAAGDSALALKDNLPDNFKAWDEDEDEGPEVITNRDLGDEQDDAE